jgi:purine-binding chemotaxis protein CheW
MADKPNVTDSAAPQRHFRGRETKEIKLIQYIVFNLGTEEFGVPIGDVQEIIRTGAITPIPDSPAFIKGVINVRGDIVATLDLRARFSLKSNREDMSKHIVITEKDEGLFGLLVDEVTEVLRVSEGAVKPPPELVTKAHREYVNGVLTIGNRLIILLDLSSVLSEEDMAQLTEAQRKHKGELKTSLMVEQVAKPQNVKAEDQSNEEQKKRKSA